MFIRVAGLAFALTAALSIPLDAQEDISVGAPISPSLLIRGPGLGALFPLGANGALSLSLSATGNVSSRSGDLSAPPRSITDIGVSAGYLRLSTDHPRLRPFRFARLSYNVQRYAPEPNNIAQTVGLAGGMGVLAQVTPRLGLFADVGVSWSLRRQELETTMPFPPTTFNSEETATNWGIIGGVGVTLRAKPKR